MRIRSGVGFMRHETLVAVKGLTKHFATRQGFFGGGHAVIRALNGIDLDVRRGETLGIVGESGCGKSTLGRCLLRLEEPTAGSITFDGHDIHQLDRPTLRRLRREIQAIFQDPYSALNPRKTVGSIIGEGFRIHGMHTPKERRERVRELIGLVGLRPEHIDRYPHEFSGGQRQRIGIARALALNPKLVVADEAVSALDVSIQAQILNLLVSLQKQLGLTYIFISHDLGVVRHISDRVGVMYLGRIVELASVQSLYSRPAHPYTKALLSAVPEAKVATGKRRIVLAGDVPSPAQLPKGCPFHPRCSYRQDICETVAPPLVEIDADHVAACHFPLAGHPPAASISPQLPVNA
jgi:oligopeptide/dipeptide ABC transporter ATP-binding protein